MATETWLFRQFTNFEERIKKPETELTEHLGGKYLQLVNNGIIALQLAIKAKAHASVFRSFVRFSAVSAARVESVNPKESSFIVQIWVQSAIFYPYYS